jgi:hypothetical protein
VEGFFVAERRADFVGPSHIDEGEGVGSGLDIADVDFFQFFDLAENVPQLGANFLLFVWSQGETR